MTTTNPTPPPPFPVTPRRPGDPEPDLTGFELVHRALRSGTRDLAAAVSGVAAGAPCSRERQREIVRYALAVLHEVHCHHEREDDVLWPVIAASAGNTVDLDPLVDDHTVLQGMLIRVERALPAFARDAATGAPELAAALTELADLLDEHIAEEEATVFPVVRAHVSAADFARCEKQFQRASGIGQLAFVLPWVADQATAAERAEALASAGAPLRLLLRLTEGRWTRRRDLVRGTN
jgi:hemerythrin-like domain-containing protein